MKVPLLLKEIESKTEDPVEKEAIKKILQSKESSLRDLDDKMKWLKNFERLLEIQRNVVWPGRKIFRNSSNSCSYSVSKLLSNSVSSNTL